LTVVNFRAKDRFHSYQSVGFSRVLLLNGAGTLKDAHFAVFASVSGLLFDSSCMDPELYNDLFPSSVGGYEPDLYELRLENPNKRRLRTYLGNKSCPFCTSVICSNCPMAFSEVRLRTAVAKSPQDRDFRLEVMWRSDVSLSYNVAERFHANERHPCIAEAVR
jgi:hypothetical protein